MDTSSDVAGQAWLDYWQDRPRSPLLLHTSYGSIEEMPVAHFFRGAEDFPELEHFALSVCRGRVLDVGAGTGPHAYYLQEEGYEVDTLENLAAGVRIQQERGIRQVWHTNYQTYQGQRYDTVLLLMNGIGIVGTLDGLRDFLQQAKQWLHPAGQLVFDSSNIAYLYDDTSWPTDHYYGEVRYRYEYQGQVGAWFSWLYVDAKTLGVIAREAGWHMQVIFQDDNDQYLVRMMIR